MTTFRWLGALLVAFVFAAQAVPDAKTGAKAAPMGASARASEQLFQRTVLPILASNCGNCHNEMKMKGGLALTSSEKIIKGGDTGSAVTFGDPKESLLIKVVQPDGKPHMPPKGQLPPPAVAAISKWISGLKDPADEVATEKPKPEKPAAAEPKEEKPAATTSPALSDPEQLASIKLNLAKRFEKDGLNTSARTRYQEIIKSFPKTKAAEEAKERLAKLKK